MSIPYVPLASKDETQRRTTTATMEARTTWSKRMVAMPKVQAKDVRRRRRAKVVVKAASGDGKGTGKQDPRTRGWSRLWAGFARPLQDFGIGVKSTKEGGTGLFVVAGVGITVLIFSWMKAFSIANRTKSYQAIFDFPLACGIATGTPVRVRGVNIGSVLSVQPSLEKVSVLVEVKDDEIVIPRNSLIEANQSGLIAETLIDITPRAPIPDPQYGPLSDNCGKEGMIVCHRGRIQGETGVSMDELVGIATKLAKQMDQQGLDKVFDAAESFTKAMKDAQPLLDEAIAVAKEVTPMLSTINEGDMLKSMESLTATASETAKDIKKLNAAVLTDENVELMRQSVSTLTETLRHIEGISGDVSKITGDSSTQQHLKQIIQSLSRLVET
uniref:Mce/MlaD domain-containing protein n=2 Tax=Picocystis salinarum TaxID=88271 RepID=A0A6U9RQI5_9CHLO|mmetsp:Transcript_6982/g.42772  ORF Transcript_6982/g.42772 Transcript_6982/m.42772 type:complete len:385 (-) Transcript_6982:760-1914(-)|eukprot:CAMPEP_0183824688 /NCGR_PEP_ID=MMETSP0807_2-20130328/716_1 /TAXON_ID=88271 /ORGANISM="Picocystis salinarum, Strain CCMP1897" /LENGTH=384 /DNA_ID=CAMNT_0026069631 /DNA_START=79 /DNA_END=1233 /DNA_ORIENTATION=-